MNKQVKQEKLVVPRLPEEVKKLNGKSGKKLSQTIDTFCDLLDEDKKNKKKVEDKET
jgi:hypothetical protein